MKTYKVYTDICFSCLIEVQAESETEARGIASIQADRDPLYHARFGFYSGANAYDAEELNETEL